MSQYKQPTIITDSMIKLLVASNRKDLTTGNLSKLDDYTASARMLPLGVESYEPDSFMKLRNEVIFMQKIGKSSYDKNFLPELKDYKCFSKYIIDCWNILSSVSGYEKALNLTDVRDDKVIWLMNQHCELHKLVIALVNNIFRDTTDIQKLNELVLPSTERHQKIISALKEAKGYRDLIKITHALVLTEEEVVTHYDQLTKVDLDLPHYVTWVSWLFDEEGNRVRKLQEYRQALTADGVLNLVWTSPDDAVRSAVHVMNMETLQKIRDQKEQDSEGQFHKDLQQKAQDEAAAHIVESKRKSSIIDKVTAGTATYDELQEYLSW